MCSRLHLDINGNASRMNEFNRLSLSKRRLQFAVRQILKATALLPLSENFVRWKNLRGFHPVIRASLRPILLLVLLGCTIAVLTYATVKISNSRNNSKAAFTIPMKPGSGSLLAKPQPSLDETTRSSTGANSQKPVVYGSAYEGWNPDPTALESPSSLATNLLSNLPVEDRDYGTQGTTVPLHSSDDEPLFPATRFWDKPTPGFYAMPASPLPSHHPRPVAPPPSSDFPTSPTPAGPGSAEGSPSQPIIVGVIDVNPEKCKPPVTPVPEPSWFLLAATALAFSVFGWAARAVLTRLSRERRTHSGM